MPAYAEDKPIVLASSLSTIYDMRVPIRLTNTSPTPFTIKKNTVVAEFHITTPKKGQEHTMLIHGSIKGPNRRRLRTSTRVRKRTAENDGKTRNDPTVLVPHPGQPGRPLHSHSSPKTNRQRN